MKGDWKRCYEFVFTCKTADLRIRTLNWQIKMLSKYDGIDSNIHGAMSSIWDDQLRLQAEGQRIATDGCKT